MRLEIISRWVLIGYGIGIVVAVLFGVASGAFTNSTTSTAIFAGLPQLVFAGIGLGIGIGESAQVEKSAAIQQPK